jgi:hypothetical protein
MTLDDWLAVYEQDPLDFGLLLPFSDWCREQGDERAAACLLWCHRHERAPDGPSMGNWIWWNAGEYGRSGLATSGDLPRVLWQRLQHPQSHVPVILKEYERTRAALLALLAVWQQHPLLPCGHPPCCLASVVHH